MTPGDRILATTTARTGPGWSWADGELVRGEDRVRWSHDTEGRPVCSVRVGGATYAGTGVTAHDALAGALTRACVLR